MEDRRFFALDERLEKLAQRWQTEDALSATAFDDRITVGWLYHDNALEGVVLTYQEIRDALAGRSCSESGMESVYEEIRGHKAAIDRVKAVANRRPKPGFVTVDLIKQLYEILTPELKTKGSNYRNLKDNSRLYHHEIAKYDKIPDLMNKLCAYLRVEQTALHPLTVAISAHYELMSIYPWSRNSGKMARLLMNLLLLSEGYPPVIIPGNERQRYYESLRRETVHLADLVSDSLVGYCAAANRHLDELAGHR